MRAIITFYFLLASAQSLFCILDVQGLWQDVCPLAISVFFTHTDTHTHTQCCFLCPIGAYKASGCVRLRWMAEQLSQSLVSNLFPSFPELFLSPSLILSLPQMNTIIILCVYACVFVCVRTCTGGLLVTNVPLSL